MKTQHSFRVLSARLLAAMTGVVLASTASAQIVTNWAAYNDHRPGPLIPPHVSTATSWGTALRVTTMDMGAPGDTTGNLTNFINGQQLPATITFTRNGTPNDFGALTAPGIATPAGQLFYGVCDLSNGGIVGLDTTAAAVTNSLTIRFNNLNPEKRYVFRGTGGRGGGYAPRWSVATISAGGWIDAHINGTGPGVITSNLFPNLGAGQAAWNSGHNVQGAVVGWDFIAPAADGSFSILCEQYIGPTPNGGTALIDSYGYSFGALLLAEVEASAPVITTNPPAITSVEQNRPLSLSVAASGTPLLYQWYKEGVGAIPGATFATYSVAQAALSDSGRYYAVVYNPLDRATSTVAQVTVFADTTAAGVASAYSYPTVDASGVFASLDQIVVEFNEPVQAASVSSTSSYTVPGGGNPVSVNVVSDRTVILMLASPLAEDTDYSVTVSGAVDAVGNVAGSSATPFHSWATGPGNGLIFEAFRAGTGVEVATLTSSPNFPDNPFLRTPIRAFDSRVVFPDNTEGEYGSRIGGVFIPPVSGNWVFFLRTYDRGVVYLNPNGLDPAGKQEILRESTGNDPRDWNKFTSAPFALRGGQGYYIESLHKADAGTGTDVIKVAARLAGTGFPGLGVPNTEVDTNSIASAAIGYPLAPRNLGGSLTITQDLANVTAENNNVIILSLGVANPSLLPLYYQWFRDGSPIAGANGPTYTFQPTIAADNGATFSVQASKVGSSVTSRTAILTVVPDTTAPRVLEVFSSFANLTNITVRFSEKMTEAEAEDPFAYDLGLDVTVLSGVLRADGRTVDVQLAEPLTQDQSYQVSINSVTDLAGLPLNPSPTLVTFIAGADAPRLRIALSGNSLLLSWPVSLTGFVVEQADQIVNPVTAIAWTTTPGTPQVENGRNTLSAVLGPTSRVFRLRR